MYRTQDVLDFNSSGELILTAAPSVPYSMPSKIIAYISSVPTMPLIDINLNMSSGFSLTREIAYTASISYKEHQRNDVSPKVSGRSNAPNFKVNFGNTIQGGFFEINMTIPWTHTSGENGTAIVTGTSSVRGKNPSKADVKALLASLNYKVIGYKESQFRQFDGDSLPIFGVPRGFGLMQLDNSPVPTARQLWNWRENVNAGKAMYVAKTSTVDRHTKNVQKEYPDAPDLTPDQLKLAYYQYYNGGYYWQWKDDQKKWVKREGLSGYGDDAVRIEDNINNGISVGGWS